MSETYIKAVLGKEAYMQDCLKLVKELEGMNLVETVEVRSSFNKLPKNKDEIFFTPVMKRWDKKNLDADELKDDLGVIRKILYESMDLMADLHIHLFDFDFDCIHQDTGDDLLDEVRDIEITFEKVSELLGKFKGKVKGGYRYE